MLNFLKNKIHSLGFGGNPNAHELADNVGRVLDLSVLTKLNKQVSQVMSSRVEHLPKNLKKLL